METPRPITGPYRATRLWNEAIRTFNNGVPRKRHWRQLRQYENCFTASEAVSWLHMQLKVNPHFGPAVTKDQIQQLLCKFLKAGVFEDVRGVECKVEHFKDNSGLYRLTNRSPFRNPRTPGRAPLSSLANRTTNVDNSGSPVINRGRGPQPRSGTSALKKKAAEECNRTLVQCQLTSRQLKQEEVEDVWMSMTLRRISTVLGVSSCEHMLDSSLFKGKWILWNATHTGMRGIVQPMKVEDSPPSWVLYGMKSLVNWPASNNHKLPEYSGSEKDVFKVICDYFTNTSGPLTTFSMYNILIESFIRAEAYDAQFRNNRNDNNDEDACSFGSRDSVHSLVMKMASPVRRPNIKNQAATLETNPTVKTEVPSLPLVKSPILYPRVRYSQVNCSSVDVPDASAVRRSSPGQLERELPVDACYETAFTSAVPETRIIPHDSVPFLRCSSRLSSRGASAPAAESGGGRGSRCPSRISQAGGVERKLAFQARNKENNYSSRSLERLRSRSGGYVNVAAYGSTDVLHWQPESFAELTMLHHSRSVSSLSSYHTTLTSPTSFFDASSSPSGQVHDYENVGDFSHLFQPAAISPPAGRGLCSYRCSPSKKLVGRRKGLEFYYGAKACRPGLESEEGKNMAIECLQLVTLLLPPELRRKLHLLLRFMSKVAANGKLRLDDDVPTKTLMINTFYRCIVCSADEADYNELLAVRLVTFFMDNAEAIMVVPNKLCVQVRDALVDMQRERIRFDPDDAVPLAYCVQVAPQRFQEQGKDEATSAIRQLLEHIIDDKSMSVKDKRKRLKQFRAAYPDIYYSRLPTAEAEALVTQHQVRVKQPMLARIRSLRL